MNKKKLLELLEIVVENYISRWDPVGSKLLNSLESTDYAPSTLRKYLNILEGEWFLYQPYHSAGRLPTIKWVSTYIDNILQEDKFELTKLQFDAHYARNSLNFVVETLWNKADWAVVGFLRNDEYYFLWINNLLSQDAMKDYETFKYIVWFIEDKKVMNHFNKKMLKENNVNYSFIKDNWKILSILYSKININWYDWFISIIWPVRINYKKNLSLLKKFIKIYNW